MADEQIAATVAGVVTACFAGSATGALHGYAGSPCIGGALDAPNQFSGMRIGVVGADNAKGN